MMEKWKYVEHDGNPDKPGYYEVAIEPFVSYADNTESNVPEKCNKIRAYDKPKAGISYWDGEKWTLRTGSLVMDADYTEMFEPDTVYAWADVLLPAPKMIYPNKDIKINPAEYHLTEAQLINFLKDYKWSFEKGYTE